MRVPVAPGPRGVHELLPTLALAMDGSGPAIAPIPAVSATVSTDYVGALLRATRPDDVDAPLESDDVAVVVCTSGSTGDPRGVLLSTPQLTAHTAHVNAGDPVWVVALPVTSIGGLNVLVRSLATTHDPVVLPSVGGAEPFTSAMLAGAIEEARSSADDVLVSLVPAQLTRALDDPRAVAALTACRRVLVGAAATRAELLERARDTGISVTTTYGSTETAGGCVYDGAPLPGTSLHIEQPDADGVGRLVVCGPSVASGYRLDPVATAQLFTPAGFRTSDLGRVDAQGRVTVLGRIDDVVIVGGVNVSPTAVEHAAAAVTGVRSAAAVTGQDAEGAWLGVVVEADAADSDLAERVRDQVASTLGRAARPRWVRVVDSLPHLPSGKVDRARLLAEGGQ